MEERFPGEHRLYGVPLALSVWEMTKELERNEESVTVANIIKGLREEGLQFPVQETDNLRKRIDDALGHLLRMGWLSRKEVKAYGNFTKFRYSTQNPFPHAR
jgi:hypothetical protein